MNHTFKHLKPLALTLAIVLGHTVHSARAEAAESETAIFAGGCFWCVESDFERVEGVQSAVSGFAGGDVPDPSYRQVTGGGTGHYEVVQITYDPDQVSYAQLASMFFRSIDPTDDGGQFCDRGPSYRTAIFATSQSQFETAKEAKAEAQEALGQEIVTPIERTDAFYEAGEYHQDYYKSEDIILTRFGPKRKAEAYKRYREACGRDERVRELWGENAPFVGAHS